MGYPAAPFSPEPQRVSDTYLKVFNGNKAFHPLMANTGEKYMWIIAVLRCEHTCANPISYERESQKDRRENPKVVSWRRKEDTEEGVQDVANSASVSQSCTTRDTSYTMKFGAVCLH